MKIHSLPPPLPPPPPPPPVRTSTTPQTAAVAELWTPVAPTAGVKTGSRLTPSKSGSGSQRAGASSSGAKGARMTGIASTDLTADSSTPYVRGSLVDILT